MLLEGKAGESSLDIVIKAREKDLCTFLQLQADLQMHSRLKGSIYVFVPRDDLQFFEPIIDKNFILVPLEAVLKDFGHKGDFEDTWMTQQILKILAAKVVAHEQYLILDSNTLINFDFDERFFLSREQYVYAIGDYNNVAWELQSRNFLNVRRPGPLFGFRDVNQIFLKKNVVSLIAHLEQTYQRNFLELLLAYSNEHWTEYWTEYTLYGVFCCCILEASGHSLKTRNDVFHFVKNKVNFEDFLLDVREERPLMIKLHKYRPTYKMSDDEYKNYVSHIKAVYK